MTSTLISTRTNDIRDIVQRLKDEASSFEKDYRNKDATYLRAYKGDHYSALTTSSWTRWKTRKVVNYTGDAIDFITSFLIEQSLHPYPVPPSEDQEHFTFALQEVIDKIWRDNKLDTTTQEDFIKTGLILGKSYIKVYFDPFQDEGKGGIVVSVIAPKNVFLDPTCNGNIKRARYLIWEAWIPYDEAIRKYPRYLETIQRAITLPVDKSDVYTDEVSPGGVFNSDATKTWDLPIHTPTSSSSTDLKDFILPNIQTESKVKITEAWLKDFTEEEVKEGRGRKYKYTNNIRLITIINDVVVQDTSTPYKNVKQFPWTMWLDKKVPFESTGLGTVSQVWSSQLDVNKKGSYIGDYITFAGNPVWIIDKEAEIDKSRLTNVPGLIIMKERGGDVRRESPPEIPQSIFQTVRDGINEIRELSGSLDVLTGRQIPGTRSGSMLGEMKEAASGKVLLKKLALKEAIAEIGEIMLGIIKEYYTDIQILRIVGDYRTPRYFPFSGVVVDGPWVIKVEAMPSTQVSRQARFDQGIRLYTMQVIDKKALLDLIDFPNREQVLERIDKAQSAYFNALATRQTYLPKRPPRY